MHSFEKNSSTGSTQSYYLIVMTAMPCFDMDKNIFIKPFFIGINYCIGVIVSKLATI